MSKANGKIAATRTAVLHGDEASTARDTFDDEEIAHLQSDRFSGSRMGFRDLERIRRHACRSAEAPFQNSLTGDSGCGQ